MWIVLLKELREILRERRTLIVMLLVPALLMPLLMGGLGALGGMMAKKEMNKPLPYAVFGAANSPAFARALANMEGARRVPLASPAGITAALADESILLAVEIPAGFDADLAAGKPAAVKAYYNDAVSVDVVGKRLKTIKDTLATEVRRRYLASRGLTGVQQDFASKPFDITVVSSANERERLGEMIGIFLPYILLMTSISACMVAALDTGAGEKERGTLESLLLLPVSRTHLVLAKFTAVALTGVIAGAVQVISMAVWLALASHIDGMAFLATILSGIGAREFALIALLVLPANAIVAAILLTVSFIARTYKEASSYSGQLMFLLVIPVALSMLPGMKLASAWAWMPVTNISLAIKEVLKGTLTLSGLGIVLLSTLLASVLLIRVCVHLCQQEKVLFRS